MAIWNFVHYTTEFSPSNITWPDIICSKVTLLQIILGIFNKQLIWINGGFKLMTFPAVLKFFASVTVSKIR
jgi:hypothetical protein